MAVGKCPWQAAGLLLVFVAGCGAQYRPVVTPVFQTGPASQPTAYFVAVSSPSPTSAGLVTIVNAFGDTVVAQAALNNGPFAFTLNSTGSIGYNINSNASAAGLTGNGSGSFTLNSYGITVGTSSGGGLRTQNISTSTIPATAFPINALSTTTNLYLVEPYISPTTLTSTNGGTGFIGQLTGSVPALRQEIPVAPNPINLVGTAGGPRVYAISQGSTATGPLATANACSTPGSVATAGEADSIETTTNTVSNAIPLGRCPVYGVMSPDYLRAFILNRADGTVTVINAQKNIPDTVANVGTGTGDVIPVGAGPVYADLYAPSSLLVTANYDSNTISVINVPTDIYGNDGPTFAQSTHTIPVGNGPVAVTILRDGSKAYVANQKDGTVSVVNLSTFTVTKTIPLNGGHPKSIASVYSTPTSKVYVASPDTQTLTAISSQTDTVSAAVNLPGAGVAVYSSTQNAALATSSNAIIDTDSSGFGVPCATDSTGTLVDTSPFCAVP